MLNFEKTSIFNIPYTRISFNQALETIISLAKIKNGRKYALTPNVQHVYLYHKNIRFKKAYDEATLSLVDGFPIVLASMIFNNILIEKVSGSDLFQTLLPRSIIENCKVFLLGGMPGVAEKAATLLCGEKEIDKNMFCFSPSFGFESKEETNDQVIQKINSVKPNILFIALGTPKGEIWVNENINKINVGIAIQVGASFDYIAGVQKRAPKIIQNIGLEWLFRLVNDPKRLWKRYLITNSFFVFLVFKNIFAMLKSKKQK